MRGKRGQMRIFEAVIACSLILMGHHFLSYSTSSVSTEKSEELETMAQNLLNTLQDQALVLAVINDEAGWNASIRELVESILPPDVLYNISMISLYSGEVLADEITNIDFANNLTRFNVATIQGVYTFSYPIVQKEDVPLDIIMVMDRSGSMGEKLPGDAHDKIYYAKIAACNFIDRLNITTDKVGMVAFATTSNVEVGLTYDYAYVKMKINNLAPSGWTNMGAGIDDANEQFETYGRNGVTWVMILLSDGVPNYYYKNGQLTKDPDEPEFPEAKEYVINMSQITKQMGVRIYTIGLGDRYATDWRKKVDEELLKAIQTDGYFYAPSAEDLDRIYQTIAEDLIYEVRYDVVLISITLKKAS